MTGTRRAIVAPIAGTTRDALARPVDWRGIASSSSDTGGLFGASEDPLHELVVQRGQRALADADLLVLLVDGREGLVPGDEHIARERAKPDVPVVLAINKTDDKRARRRDGVLSARLRPGRSRSAPSTATASASCSTDRRETRIAPGADRRRRIRQTAEAGDAARGRRQKLRRDRRPAQRRQVVAGQPPAARRADDRSAICRARRATPSTRCCSWHRAQFRIVDTAGMRRPGRLRRGRSSRSACCWRSARSRGRRRRAGDRRDRRPTDQDAAIAGALAKRSITCAEAHHYPVVAATLWRALERGSARPRTLRTRRGLGPTPTACCGATSLRPTARSRRAVE